MEQIERLKKLEDEFLSLYEKKFYKEEKRDEYETLDLDEGDWIYSLYFKKANKIKRINKDKDYVEFYFKEENDVKGGSLKFIENKNDIKNHRYATLNEIEERLLEEITKMVKD